MDTRQFFDKQCVKPEAEGLGFLFVVFLLRSRALVFQLGFPLLYRTYRRCFALHKKEDNAGEKTGLNTGQRKEKTKRFTTDKEASEHTDTIR